MKFVHPMGGHPRKTGLLLVAVASFVLSPHAQAELLDLSVFGHGQIITNVTTSNGTIVVSAEWR
jgi:hypothetical protein